MIWAMGATHTDKVKLKRIVDSMTDNTMLFNDLRESNYDQILDMLPNKIKELPELMDRVGRMMIYKDCGWISEIKEDGFSYLNTGGDFISRSPSTAADTKGMPVIKTNRLPQFKNLFEVPFGVDLHGELFKPGGISDDVTRVMGCSPEKAIKRQQDEGYLQYFIYDIRAINDKDITNAPWWVRRAVLEIFKIYLDMMGYNDFIQLSKVYIGDPRELFSKVVNNSGEGLMLKDVNGQYKPGKKPANNWVKAKKEITAEVVILGFDFNGTGKNVDLFRSLTVGMYKDGKLIDMGQVNSGISDELRNQLFDNQECTIGRPIEVTAMECTKKGKFRSARFKKFRDDKLATDCIFLRYDQFASNLDMI